MFILVHACRFFQFYLLLLDDIIIIPCFFFQTQNRYHDIRQYFRENYGIVVKDIVFNQRTSAGKSPTKTAIVSFFDDAILYAIEYDKPHNINGR